MFMGRELQQLLQGISHLLKVGFRPGIAFVSFWRTQSKKEQTMTV